VRLAAAVSQPQPNLARTLQKTLSLLMILQRARLLACRVPAPAGVSCSSAAGASRAFSASSIPGAGPGRGAQGASSGERGVGARPG
jgi:hypothetical protein